MIKSMRKIEVFRYCSLKSLKQAVNDFMAKVASKNPRCVGYATDASMVGGYNQWTEIWYSALVEYDE